ncbi:tyrosine kinase receptor Cad96Ca-like [Ambystoma mexicanum]|uniref:tyrosine kinase receptor Cad96Ca-like n=1 Tax=Ambystoma mexicanum TaxID=8296 RepID=UPI0037E714DF
MEHRNGTGNQSRIVRDVLSLTSTECTKTSSLAVTEVQGDIFFSFKFHWMYAVLPLATVISVAIAFALWKRCSGHAQCFPFMNNRTCHREDPHMLIPTIADTCVLPQEKASSRWHPVQKNRVYTVKDITVLEMIKNGKHGHFYRAQLNHGCCKGHKLIICKVFREGISASLLHSETLIMKKVGYHKHILQFLDCNAVQEPYMLILENVACGTLKQFLKVHRRQLSASENLHSHLTVAAYHIALAMEHIASKMVLHRDLALRNILIGSFPYECKIAEFGYARDLSSRGGATKYPKFWMRNVEYSVQFLMPHLELLCSIPEETSPEW